jgi:hypothetical protein
MGGQLGFMSWFIDSTLEKGHSEGGIVTFKPSERLAKRSPFHVDQLEVWSLCPTALQEKATFKQTRQCQKSALIAHQDLLCMVHMSSGLAQDPSDAYDETDITQK